MVGLLASAFPDAAAVVVPDAVAPAGPPVPRPSPPPCSRPETVENLRDKRWAGEGWAEEVSAEREVVITWDLLSRGLGGAGKVVTGKYLPTARSILSIRGFRVRLWFAREL